MAEVEIPNPEELHERGGQTFSRRVALTTAIYAIVLSIAALGANSSVKEMLLAQQQASDQWAFYQAKVIREHQYRRSQKMLLETQLAEPSSVKGAERDRLAVLAANFDDEEKRYNGEKTDIEKDAKKLEVARDLHRERHPYFEFAEVLLQIAIVSASVSILSTSRPMFWFSLVLALLGAVLTLNGFSRLFPLPLLHHH